MIGDKIKDTKMSNDYSSYFEESEPKRRVTFSMSDDDGSFNTTKYYHDCVAWPVILKDFLRFLEGSGYLGVAQRVSIEESPFLTEEWTGPTHSPEDDWK